MARHIDGDRRNVGASLKVRRERCGLGMKELANLAGVSHKLISRYESGTLNITVKSFSLIDTALRLREDNDLGMTINPKWTMAGFLSNTEILLQREIHNQSEIDGGIFPYLGIPLSTSGAIRHVSQFKQVDYQKVLASQRIGIRIMAKEINAHCKGKNIHMLCMTCGHDWLELDLARALASQTDMRVQITMIHPSKPLLENGLEEFKLEKYCNVPNLFWRGYANIYEAASPLLIAGTTKGNWRHVVCLFGLLNNYDNDLTFLQFVQQLLFNDDLIVFDVINRFWAQEDSVKQICRKDPRLNGELPALWREQTETVIKGVLMEQLQRPAAITISPTFADHCAHPLALGDYAVDLIATIDDGIRRPWRVSGMRIHRQSVDRVRQRMNSIGWRFLHRQDCGSDIAPNYVTSLLLFSR